MTTNRNQSARALPGGRVPNAITYGIRPEPTDAQLSDLLAYVWECESWERRHPLTVATIRSLAPRTRPS